MRYEVDAGLYEGPLPLLVELARLNLVDVFLIKLVALTGAYLAQIKASPPQVVPGAPAPASVEGGPGGQAGADLNQLSEPLPLLGSLVALKARGLLPQPSPVEEEEVPISLEELERRLKEYQQFKTVAQLLSELHALQHTHFGRSRGEVPESSDEAAAPPALRADRPGGEEPFDVGITDLMSAFAKVLEKATAPVYEVMAEPWTVEMKVQELRVLLTVRRSVKFLELFTPQQTKLELVVTFLALLELMRQRAARAVQERQFADILIVWREPATM